MSLRFPFHFFFSFSPWNLFAEGTKRQNCLCVVPNIQDLTNCIDLMYFFVPCFYCTLKVHCRGMIPSQFNYSGKNKTKQNKIFQMVLCRFPWERYVMPSSLPLVMIAWMVVATYIWELVRNYRMVVFKFYYFLFTQWLAYLCEEKFPPIKYLVTLVYNIFHEHFFLKRHFLYLFPTVKFVLLRKKNLWKRLDSVTHFQVFTF